MNPTTSSPRRATRWLTAFLLVVAAAAHIPLIEEHLREAPYIGWGFILFSAACMSVAVAVVLADHVAVWRLAAAICLAALVTYVVSRTIGLPELGDDVGNWTEPLSFPAMTAEALVLLLAATNVRPGSVARRASGSLRPTARRRL